MDDAKYGGDYEDGETAMRFVKKEVSGFGEWRGEKGHWEGETVYRDNFFGVSTPAESREAGRELAGYSGLRNFVCHLPSKQWKWISVLMLMRMFPNGERSWCWRGRGIIAEGLIEAGEKKPLGSLNSWIWNSPSNAGVFTLYFTGM